MEYVYWFGGLRLSASINPSFNLGFAVDAEGVVVAFGPFVLAVDWA